MSKNSLSYEVILSLLDTFACAVGNSWYNPVIVQSLRGMIIRQTYSETLIGGEHTFNIQ